ncbi:hypothetical protein [Archangium lansingense]|uniref:Uncharacterized protein n=1 Tax=Archangium lansingense TaxID=2995310 RepID=A0ABT3ZUY4_9BACT|nr:hypothetical protein [Archangium lansinium]MCY1073215.1 hypothetical protein [Archangium lansinium]
MKKTPSQHGALVMTTPPNSNKTFALYALGYALTIASLIVDVRLGSAIFALIGFAGSLVITTRLIYQAARAMAYSPTPARLQMVPVHVTSGSQRIAA